MSNLNGGNVRSLMEAYNSIYEQPQEETLTEEQIWEEVEAWVNSLIEEGYDLSQFTWEEVFQAYVDGFEQLDEQGQRGSGMRNAPSDRFQQQLSGVGSFFRGLGSQGTMQGGRSRFNNRKPTTTQPAANPAATSRPAPAAAAPPKDVIVKAAKGGVPGTLNKTTGKWTASAPAAAAPTKPSAPLADKVTPATKPTTSYAGATGVKPVGTPIQGGVKPVAGAPTQASLSTAKPEEKANILGNKASELAALQAKAKADTMARRQTTQRPMGPRGM